MMRRLLLSATAALALPATPVRAAAWPDRPVNIVVPFGPGTAQDVVARLIAPRLGAGWGQPVVVVNAPGASGTLGVDRVARSARDNHTVVLSGDAAIVVRVSMAPRPPYNPQRDLAPITLVGRTPNILVVAASGPIQSFPDLLRAGKAQPLTFGHAGVGTSQHIGGEMLAQMAGLELTGVSYNDPAAQILDVRNGRVTMSFQSGVVALPLVRDGTFRPLAVSSVTRLAALPEIPTVAEQGLAGFDAAAWLGMFGPAGMPEEVVSRISRDVAAALNDPAIRPRLQELGVEVVGSTPDELRDLVAREIPRMAGVLERAGIRPD